MKIRIDIVSVVCVFLALVPAAVFAGGAADRKSGEKPAVLVVATQSEPGNLDPLIGGTPSTTQVVSAVYETPVGYTTETIDGFRVQTVDDHAGWKPLLAREIEVSPDGKVLTFHLRRGVRFYPGGREMTAADWIWSWERQLSDPPIGWGQFENGEASITAIEQVSALDQYTVRITLPEANARALPFMRFQMFAIYDSEEVKKHTTPDDPWATEWLSRNTAGTGPYYIRTREAGNQIVLEKNPFYWGEEPYFDSVVLKVVPELATRVALLKKGDVDIASGIPPKFAGSLEGSDGVNVLSVPSGNRTYLAFNVAMPPFDDMLLRKAILWAIPYDGIISSVYGGHGRRSAGFVLPEVPAWTDENFFYEFDPGKAQELLSGSVAGNVKLALKIDGSKPEHREIALLIQDNLSRIGLEVTIDPLPSGEFTSRLFRKELDFFIHSGISWIDDPSTIAGLWMVSGAFGNFTRFSNPEVDALQEEWQFASPSWQRDDAYRKIQSLYNSEVNVAYLALENFIVGMRAGLSGFVLYKDAGIRFHELSGGK